MKQILLSISCLLFNTVSLSAHADDLAKARAICLDGASARSSGFFGFSPPRVDAEHVKAYCSDMRSIPQANCLSRAIEDTSIDVNAAKKLCANVSESVGLCLGEVGFSKGNGVFAQAMNVCAPAKTRGQAICLSNFSNLGPAADMARDCATVGDEWTARCITMDGQFWNRCDDNGCHQNVTFAEAAARCKNFPETPNNYCHARFGFVDPEECTSYKTFTQVHWAMKAHGAIGPEDVTPELTEGQAACVVGAYNSSAGSFHNVLPQAKIFCRDVKTEAEGLCRKAAFEHHIVEQSQITAFCAHF